MNNSVHHSHRLTGILLMMLFVALTAFESPRGESDDASDDRKISFRKDIVPLIQKNCIVCHSAESDQPAGLSFDSYEDLIAGGEHGSPVVAGSPEESFLYLKTLPDPPFGKQMPPSRRRTLSASDIEIIKKWIEQGAHKE